MGVTKKDQAGEPKPMVINADGRRKVHRTYPDGSELVEEYDQKTDVLLLRKSRKPGVLGKEGQWVIEVGQVAEKFDRHTGLLAASDTQPVFMRKDTKAEFQWRIRNLPYAKDIYDIRVDFEKNEIVVRTTNKKYFKRIDIPDLKRAQLNLDAEQLSWDHQHNTLIISYTKPAVILENEKMNLVIAKTQAISM